MFGDNSSGDAALVDSMRPSDYELRLWRFIVEHHARKQIRSDAFGDAFGKAEAQIEEQLALEGRRDRVRKDTVGRYLIPSSSSEGASSGIPRVFLAIL
jgi:hypothetical protein